MSPLDSYRPLFIHSLAVSPTMHPGCFGECWLVARILLLVCGVQEAGRREKFPSSAPASSPSRVYQEQHYFHTQTNPKGVYLARTAAINLQVPFESTTPV